MVSVSKLISLKGKSSLVTGATSGIGEATAYRLAEVGSDLYLVDINEEALLKIKNSLHKKYGI